MISELTASMEQISEIPKEGSNEVQNPNLENKEPFSDSSRPTEKGMELPALKETPENTQFSDSERPSDKNGMELPKLKEDGEKLSETENPEQSGRHQEVHDGLMHYYDDNDKLYRVENDLLPNNEYELNGYTYKTDENGRIISASGDLHLKDREGRLTIRDSIEDVGKGDEKPTDDRGHLIGDQFDGTNGLENLVPQDAGINRNDFKNFENELAKQVKDGKNVHVEVEPIYEDDSRRPSALSVTYSIDGEESIRIFPNDREV